ncbi:MAG: hypothetical protein PHX21_00060 [bacterium]|nr:hypothetical protein [bacterium]
MDINNINILLSPAVAFVIFLAIFYIFYFIIGTLAPKTKKIGGKLSTYACGEDIQGYKVQFGYKLFFFIAIFFTIMHVATLVVATVPSGRIALFGLLYLGMIFLSVLALIIRR